MLQLFISHSSRDAELVGLLIELCRAGLNLSADEIRATSVDGYRLAGGANTDEQLRREVHDAAVLIGVISLHSLESHYVVFELGARWGADRPLIPVLAPGIDASGLPGPLAGRNALRGDNGSQLHQLVHDVAALLDRSPDKPAAYQKYVDRVLKLAEERRFIPTPPPQLEAHVSVTEAESALSDTETVIGQKCAEEWPEDYAMRSQCMDQQRRAVAELRRGNVRGVPDEVFTRIRGKAAAEWPDDFQMRLFVEKQQLDAYQRLHPTT